MHKRPMFKPTILKLSILLVVLLILGCTSTLRPSEQVRETAAPDKRLSDAVPATRAPDSETPIVNTELITHVHHTTYTITGMTENELRHQIDQRSPPCQASNDHDACTTWDIQWHYRYYNQNEACWLTDIHVSTLVTITMPTWDPAPEAPMDLQNNWDTYLDALQTHEDGHRDRALATGRAVLDALSDLPTYPTCDMLKDAVDITAQGVLATYAEHHVQYDEETDHGATQGARFP